MKKLSKYEKMFTEHNKGSLKRHTKWCKKNKKKPHEYGEPILHKYGWTERFCIHCNKKKFEWIR